MKTGLTEVFRLERTTYNAENAVETCNIVMFSYEKNESKRDVSIKMPRYEKYKPGWFAMYSRGLC